jgi:hypothetical protein
MPVVLLLKQQYDCIACIIAIPLCFEVSGERRGRVGSPPRLDYLFLDDAN